MGYTSGYDLMQFEYEKVYYLDLGGNSSAHVNIIRAYFLIVITM